MKYGAGYVAAKKFGAAEIIDPRPYAVGSIIETYKKYPHLDVILPPAMATARSRSRSLKRPSTAPMPTSSSWHSS